MTKAVDKTVIVDIREPVSCFYREVGAETAVPDHVLQELINMAYDSLMFEDQTKRADPNLTRLGNFFRYQLEPNPAYFSLVQKGYFALVDSLCEQLRDHGIMGEFGLGFIPKQNRNNKVLILSNFEMPY